MSNKLPVIGSTAASTDFVSLELQLTNDGRSLHLDGNQKISGWRPRANAFSLRAQAVTNRGCDAQISDPPAAHEDCPGSTEACRASCYVGGLEKAQRAIYDLYDHNSRNIRDILAVGGGYAIDWADFLGGFIAKNCQDTGFRWHVSGDVFSAKYARWIVEVCRASLNVEHWIYTRSFDYVADLIPVSSTRTGGNLSINISADRDNIDEALDTASKHGLRVCYMATRAEDVHDLAHLIAGDVIFPDYALRPKGLTDPMLHWWWKSLTVDQRKMVCPVDAFGKSESVRCGVCTKCMK